MKKIKNKFCMGFLIPDEDGNMIRIETRYGLLRTTYLFTIMLTGMYVIDKEIINNGKILIKYIGKKIKEKKCKNEKESK